MRLDGDSDSFLHRIAHSWPGFDNPGGTNVVSWNSGQVTFGQSPPKGLSSSVFRFQGTAFQYLAARYVVVRGQGEPRGKMLDRRPAVHIRPSFGDDFLDAQGIQTIDLGQVNTRNLVKIRA